MPLQQAAAKVILVEFTFEKTNKQINKASKQASKLFDNKPNLLKTKKSIS